MEKILNQIRDFADKAHGEQLRKYTPERYIVHPVRVMETCRNYDNSLPVLAAALLHDVLEDTPTTSNQLLVYLNSVMDKNAAQETLLLVEELSDVYVKADYPQWNRRFRKSKELERIATTSEKAQTIKYADIIDNSKEITSQDPGFAPHYLKECRQILEVADKGNKALHRLAKDAVEDGLAKLNS